MKLDHDTEEGVHNIRYKSMNCKRRNQILKKYCFFSDTSTNSSSWVPAILTSRTRQCLTLSFTQQWPSLLCF